MLMTLIIDYLLNNGMERLVREIVSVHATRKGDPKDTLAIRPISLTVALAHATAVMDVIVQLMIASPLFLTIPAGTYASAVVGSANPPMLLKVFCYATANSWISKFINESYAFIRVSPGGTLSMNVVRNIVEQFNSKRATPLFTEMLHMDSDRSQTVVIRDQPLPGNDYVIVVRGCTFTDKVSFQVPLRSILQNVLGSLAASQPELKTFTLFRFVPGDLSKKKKRVAPPAESSAKRQHTAG